MTYTPASTPPKKYVRPLNIQEYKVKYPNKINQLLQDPVNRWRAETGMELIDKKPKMSELTKTWKNWKLMTDYQKQVSDLRSIQLFGVDNKDHYYKLLALYGNR